MLDIRFIRENADAVQRASEQKGYRVSISDLLELDDSRRDLQKRVDELRQRRNEVASRMKGGKPEQDLVDRGKAIKAELGQLESQLDMVNGRYMALLKQVPNMPHADVPVGLSEDENIEVKVVGNIPKFDFAPKNHYEIAEAKGWLDKERAAKVAGARFAYIMGDLVLLQQAIIQFVITSLTNPAVIKEIAKKAGLDVDTKPFIPVLPPLMIRTEPYDQMDRLQPSDDRYKIEGEELWLQGSAEHVLGSMHAGEIFDAKQLPLRYLGFATSFRKEAGTYGKDMEGLIRMHQFDKLEMESFTEAKDSYSEHLLFIAIQEWLLTQLKLPYHVLMKCTADIGKPNARGVDMEVWLPGQGKYRETHTADYMTDYQARRLQTRVRNADGVSLVHTNDATAFALGRCMVAIIENYQTAEGNVVVPEVLRPYLGGLEEL
ncbi:serine--tRNA ligase [Candidatus Saccharibacteria bacterium oral taxon 955]|nr:serine--tRNA ligase [Candidatus Saccharibacteria bacterium oral taxon 955]QJU05663.1 serine--tRNA ligase [Candidatus Saccharibacteria bacterium oral taxon 955]